MAATDIAAPVYPLPEHSECPFPVFDQIREEKPVYEVPGRGEFLVTRHEDLVFVSSNPDIFSSSPPDVPWSPGWSETMIAKDPPDHTVRRKVAYRSFTPAKIRSYEPMVEEIVEELIDSFIDHGETEFVTSFANPLSLFVISRLLGLPREDASWLERLLGPFEAQGIRYLSEERQQQQEANGAIAVDYLREHVVDRIKNPGDDALSDLIANHTEAEGGTPDIEYLAVEANVILAGGLTTSGHLFASAMVQLIQDPALMERVREDQSLIPKLLEETLRLETPAQYQPRYAQEDTELGGVAIPRGACLLILYAAANRDPEKFECPADFDVDRDNIQKHVGWGHGAHFCLGAPLARMEGRVAFEKLLTRLHDIRPAMGKNDFSHYQSVYFRAPNAMQIWFERADRDPFGLRAKGELLRP